MCETSTTRPSRSLWPLSLFVLFFSIGFYARYNSLHSLPVVGSLIPDKLPEGLWPLPSFEYLKSAVGIVGEPESQDAPACEATFEISGMDCSGCVRKARKALLAVPGVKEAHVTLKPPRGSVGLVEMGAVAWEQLGATLENLGFGSVIVAEETDCWSIEDEDPSDFTKEFDAARIAASGEKAK